MTWHYKMEEGNIDLIIGNKGTDDCIAIVW